MSRKEKLIERLKEERDSFKLRGNSTTEHDIVIQYLLLGDTNYNPDKWDLLYAAMYDFETLCNDYDC